jgi:hypothetical protein
MTQPQTLVPFALDLRFEQLGPPRTLSPLRCRIGLWPSISVKQKHRPKLLGAVQMLPPK